MAEKQQKKAGIVTLAGRSNVGKSTLLNALVGFKVAPVSSKPQMTRLPVQGILNDERGQIVFVDTPGLFMKKKDDLTRVVNKQVEASLKGIDVLLYVVDPTREIGQEERRLLSLVRNIPNKIFLINKTDIKKPPYLIDYEILSEEFEHTIKISAKTRAHLKSLVTLTFDLLPEGQALYEDGTQNMDEFSLKTWLAEMIREKIFNTLRQEVPYAMHVEVETLEEMENGMLYIEAVIYTNDKRYRPMIIGKGGRTLKEIGSTARSDLELLMNKKIYLSLEVENDPHWIKRLN